MKVFKQPKKMYREFVKSPRRYLREYCNIAGANEDLFILFPERIEEMFSYNITNPFDDMSLLFDNSSSFESI